MGKNQVVRWVLIASLLLSMFAPVLQAQNISPGDQLLNYQTPNLINNGSFEEPLAEDGSIPDWNTWTPRGNAVFSVDEVDPKEGEYAVQISATEPDSVGALVQHIPVEEQKTYLISYWAKSEDVDFDMCACVRIQFRDEAGGSTRGTTSVGNIRGTQDWRYFEHEITMPENTVRFAIEPILWAADGKLWFDDLRLTEVNQNQSENLLSNSSFEEPVSDTGTIPNWETWVPSGDAIVSIVYGDAPVGDYSAYISATEPSSTGALVQRRVPVEGGKAYSLSYWIKSEDVEFESISCGCVRVQYKDETGANAKGLEELGRVASTQEWTFAQHLVTPTAGTVHLIIEPMLYRGKGKLWFDDIKLSEVNPDQPGSFLYNDISLHETGVVNVGWITDHLPNNQPIFDVYRSIETGFAPGDDTRIGSTEENKFADQSTSSGQTYYYKIAFTSPDGGKRIVSEEMEVGIPVDLPAVQPVDSFKAIDTINRTLGFYWDIDSGQRAATVNLYGDDEPITEERKGEAILVASSIPATVGEYTIEPELHPGDVKPYYALSVVDGDGNESALSSQEVYSFLPRIDESVMELEHPHLFANQETIDTVIDNMEKYPWMQMTRNIILQNADSAVLNFGSTTEIPPPNSDTFASMRVSALNSSIAYVLTGDERYAETVKNILMLYVGYYAEHEYIHNQKKDDGYHVIHIAWAYDFIYNSSVLTDEERQQIEDGYFRVVADRLQALGRGRMSNQGVTNWAVGVIGFLLKDQKYLNDAFEHEEHGLKYNWLNGINDDSYWWEMSIGYHDERTQYTFLLAEAAYHSNYDLYGYLLSGTRDTEERGGDEPGEIEGRIIEVEDKSIKELVDFPFYFMFPDMSRPVVGDSDRANILVPNFQYEAAYTRYGDPKFGWLLSQSFGSDRAYGGIRQLESLFVAQPTLPEEPTFSIGSGYFNKRGYNKLGSSIFLDTGMAMLRSEGDYQTSTNLATHWSRVGTLGHSHADKLGIVMYGNGKEILYDPGRYVYGTAGHREFAQHTIAHNTLVVDEKSQYPYTDSSGEWVNDDLGRTSAGDVSEITIGPVLKLIQTENHNVYEDFGVGLDRTSAMVDDYVIDVFKATSDSPHRYDYPLTINGVMDESSVELQALDPEDTLGDGIGYKFVKNLSKGMPSDFENTWSTNWDLGDGSKFRTTMLGVEDTEVIKANGLSRDGSYQNEMLIARRDQTANTIFLNVMEPYEEGKAMRTISSLPVQLLNNENGPQDSNEEHQAVQIVSSSIDAEDTFMTSLHKIVEMRQAGSLISDGVTAFHREQAGQDTVLAVINGQYVEGTELSIEMSAPSTAQMTRMNDGAMRFEFDGEKSVTVEVEGLPSYQVYEMALKDENELTLIDSLYVNGVLNFSAESEKIYILGIESGISELPLPSSVLMGKPMEHEEIPIAGSVKVIDEPLTGSIIEAEDFTYEEGGSVNIVFRDGSHTTNHPEGDAFNGWDNSGHALEWEVDVPATGNYRVMLNFATSVSNSTRTFKVGDSETYQFHFPTTPGWNDRQHALLQDIDGNDVWIHLEAGTHTMRMVNVSGALNLDYFVFEKVSSEEPVEMTIESIQNLVASYNDAGAFANEQSVRALKMHLTAVRIFEQQEDADKVVQHMGGFHILLDHQMDQSLISEKAYHDLKAETDALIERWQQSL